MVSLLGECGTPIWDSPNAAGDLYAHFLVPSTFRVPEIPLLAHLLFGLSSATSRLLFQGWEGILDQITPPFEESEMGEQLLTAAPWPPESIPGQQPQPRHEPSLSNPLTPERVTALQQKAFLSLLYYFLHPSLTGASLVVQSVKNLPSVGETCV